MTAIYMDTPEGGEVSLEAASLNDGRRALGAFTQAARAVPYDARVTEALGALEASTSLYGVLVERSVQDNERMQADRLSDREGLAEVYAQTGADYRAHLSGAKAQAHEAVQAVGAALAEVAMPRESADGSTMLAAQAEVQAALAASEATGEPAFALLARLAEERGGAVAAVAAGPYGRMLLEARNEGDQHEHVRAAALRSSLTHGDDRQRAAAAALDTLGAAYDGVQWLDLASNFAARRWTAPLPARD